MFGKWMLPEIVLPNVHDIGQKFGTFTISK